MTGMMTSDAEGKISTKYDKELKISIPGFRGYGSYGFSVQFLNGISTVKCDPVDPDTCKPHLENIQLLDPAPAGTGEWVIVSVPKWDLNFVRFTYYLLLNHFMHLKIIQALNKIIQVTRCKLCLSFKVEKYTPIEGPVLYKLRYELPDEFPG